MKEITPLFTQQQIQSRISDLAFSIQSFYRSESYLPVILLKGAVHFGSDLVRKLEAPELDFMQVSSYINTASTGNIQIKQDLDCDIKGRNVLLIEDIVDTGQTLSKVIQLLNTREPKSVRVCALLNKSCKRIIEVPVDFVGFEIGDDFVIGVGMDFNGKYRNLNYIGILNV